MPKTRSPFRIEARHLLLLAYPVSLGQAGHIMTNIADSVMVGHYNSDHLAAATFAFSLFVLPLVLEMGFSMGITPLVAQADGRGDRKAIARYFTNGLALNALAMLAMLGFSIPLIYAMPYMGQEPDIIPLARDYYIVLIPSLVTIMIFQVFRQFCEGLSETRIPMIFSLVGNGVNIVLNYPMIYGKWGFPEMGLVGAGWATLIARGSMAVLMAIYVMRAQKFSPYMRMALKAKIRTKELKELLKISLPISIQMIVEVGAFVGSVIIIGWLGKAALAAHNIAIQLTAFTYILVMGIGSAATIRVGNAVGRKDAVGIRITSRVSTTLAILFMGGASVVFLLTRNYLPMLFVDPSETEIIGLAAQLFVVVAIFEILDGIQANAQGILRGMSDVVIPAFMTTGSYWLLTLPLGYVLAIQLGYGVVGMWSCWVLGLGAASILLMWRVRVRTRSQLKEFEATPASGDEAA